MRWGIWAAVVGAALLAYQACGPSSTVATVCVAASLRDTVHALDPQWRLMSGSSGQLARQIGSGAPCDVFVSADPRWALWLREQGQVGAQDAQVIAGNGLVVVVSPGYAGGWRTAPRWATGEPRSVPLGRYAQQALEQLGVWKDMRGRLVGTADATAAARLVVAGEVDAAVLYASDAKRNELRVVQRLAASSHDAVHYVAVAVGSPTQRSKAVLDAFSSAKWNRLLGELGFSAP